MTYCQCRLARVFEVDVQASPEISDSWLPIFGKYMFGKIRLHLSGADLLFRNPILDERTTIPRQGIGMLSRSVRFKQRNEPCLQTSSTVRIQLQGQIASIKR